MIQSGQVCDFVGRSNGSIGLEGHIGSALPHKGDRSMDFKPIEKAKKKTAPEKRGSSQQTKAGRQKTPAWVDRLTYGGKEGIIAAPVRRNADRSIFEAGQKSAEERVKTRAAVMREFISEGHIAAIERAIRSTNAIVSFRAAGEATLKQIAAGAAPKPHAILDKSLKAGDFPKAGTVNGISCGQMKDALAGLVPYREVGVIKGLHLSSLGVKYFRDEVRSFNIEKIPNTGQVSSGGHQRERAGHSERSYLVCNPLSAEDPFVKWLMEKLSSNPGFRYAQWFVTGDYDLHDMALMVSQRAPVPSDSGDEARILTRLSDAIAGKEHSHLTGSFQPEEFSPIQHGPQYNYIAHMKNMEADRPIAPNVADLDLKIALYDGREWMILEQGQTEQEPRSLQADRLQRYYEEHGLKLKWIWRNTSEAERYMKKMQEGSQKKPEDKAKK